MVELAVARNSGDIKERKVTSKAHPK